MFFDVCGSVKGTWAVKLVLICQCKKFIFGVPGLTWSNYSKKISCGTGNGGHSDGGSFYRAMHFSAKRGIAIACRLSVCLSECNVQVP